MADDQPPPAYEQVVGQQAEEAAPAPVALDPVAAAHGEWEHASSSQGGGPGFL